MKNLLGILAALSLSAALTQRADPQENHSAFAQTISNKTNAASPAPEELV